MIIFIIALFFIFPGQPLTTSSSINGSRIIGGNVAFAGQFPFMAAIYKHTENGTYFCGGALINYQWILTGGQCVERSILFVIYLGTTSLKYLDQNSLNLSTTTYVIHPDFNPKTLENDLGLIKLREPVEFTTFIRPIDYLPSYELLPGTPVMAFGWGQISDEDPGIVDDLRYVYLYPISNDECKITFGDQITKEMVCVGGRFNEGFCLGDSGTPLVKYRNGPTTTHMGIASFISQSGCDSPDPSGYIRTSHYVDWIKNVTDIS